MTQSVARPVVQPLERPVPGTVAGVAAMMTSATSSQVGAALGSFAFPAIGPAGVVAIRQLVAAVVLIPIARPRLRELSWAQWWPTMCLGLAFAGMNLGLYTAIDRLGLGLAVTLEFLGPLAVALWASAGLLGLVLALLVGGGVYLLVLPGPSTDLLGIACGLGAAGCWAAYILLNRTVGARLTGLQAPALAAAVSSVLCLPILVVIVRSADLTPAALGYAALAGLLSSVVPFTADLLALRRVSAGVFALMMSLHPVLAALAGLVLLGEVLAGHECVGIVVIVLANAAALLTGGRRG